MPGDDNGGDNAWSQRGRELRVCVRERVCTGACEFTPDPVCVCVCVCVWGGVCGVFFFFSIMKNRVLDC